MLSEGEGIPTDYRKAEELYRKVLASRNETYYEGALFSLALMYSTKTNDNYKAFPLWKEAAERGNVNAQYNLGLCYHNGWGTTRNDDQAIHWWRMAAAQGHSDAQHNIDVVMQERASSSSSYSGSSSSSSSGGGCYVATAVYGSYDCPEVWTLRRYRDNSLAHTFLGRTFIKVYYAVSPTIVKWFGQTKWFNSFWKKVLDKMVSSLKESGYEDTPYND